MEFVDRLLDGFALEGLDVVGSVESQEEDMLLLLQRQQATIAGVRAEMDQKDLHAQALQERIAELEICQGELYAYKERCDHLQNQVDAKAHVEVDLKEAVHRLAEAQSHTTHLEATLSVSKRTVSDLEVLTRALREDDSEKSARLDDAVQRTKFIEQLCEGLQAELRTCEAALQSEKERAAAVNKKRTELEQHWDSVHQSQEVQVRELKERNAALHRREQQLSKDVTHWKRAHEQLQRHTDEGKQRAVRDADLAARERDELQGMCMELTDDYDDARGRHELLATSILELGEQVRQAQALYAAVDVASLPLWEWQQRLQQEREQEKQHQQQQKEREQTRRRERGVSEGKSPSRRAKGKISSSAPSVERRTPAKKKAAHSRSQLQPQERYQNNGETSPGGFDDDSSGGSISSSSWRGKGNSSRGSSSSANSSTTITAATQQAIRARSDLRAFVRAARRKGSTNSEDGDSNDEERQKQVGHDPVTSAVGAAQDLLLQVLEDSLIVREDAAATQAQMQHAAASVAQQQQHWQSMHSHVGRVECMLRRQCLVTGGIASLLSDELAKAGVDVPLSPPQQLQQNIQQQMQQEKSDRTLEGQLAALAAVDGREQEKVTALPPPPLTQEQRDAEEEATQATIVQVLCQRVELLVKALHTATADGAAAQAATADADARADELQLLLTRQQQLHSEAIERVRASAVESGAAEAEHDLRPLLDDCQRELSALQTSYAAVQAEVRAIEADHEEALATERNRSAAREEALRQEQEAELAEQVEELASQVVQVEEQRRQQVLQLRSSELASERLAATVLALRARGGDLAQQKRLLLRFACTLDALTHDVAFLAHCCIARPAERGTPGALPRPGESAATGRFSAVEFSPAVMHRLHRLSRSGGYMDNVYAYPTVARATRRAGAGARSYVLPSLRAVALHVLAGLRFGRLLGWVRRLRSKGARPMYGSYFLPLVPVRPRELVERALLEQQRHDGDEGGDVREGDEEGDAAALTATADSFSCAEEAEDGLLRALVPRRQATADSHHPTTPARAGLTSAVTATPVHRPPQSALASSGADSAGVLERALIHMSAQLATLRDEAMAAEEEAAARMRIHKEDVELEAELSKFGIMMDHDMEYGADAGADAGAGAGADAGAGAGAGAGALVPMAAPLLDADNNAVLIDRREDLRVEEGERDDYEDESNSGDSKEESLGGMHASTYVNAADTPAASVELNHSYSQINSHSRSRSQGTAVFSSPMPVYHHPVGLTDSSSSPSPYTPVAPHHIGSDSSTGASGAYTLTLGASPIPLPSSGSISIGGSADDRNPVEPTSGEAVLPGSSLKLYRQATRNHELERMRDRLGGPLDRRSTASGPSTAADSGAALRLLPTPHAQHQL